MDERETEKAVKELRKKLRSWVKADPTTVRKRVAKKLRVLLKNRDALDAIVVALRRRVTRL